MKPSTSGPKPLYYLDKIQIEASGTPVTYSLAVDRGDRFHIEEIVFAYADALASTITGLADGTENATLPGLSYNKILGESALTNGFIITRSKGGVTLFAATIKTIGDHIAAGATIDSPMSDGTNTFITLRAKFGSPLVLTGDVSDILTITVNDDMSGLLQFTVSARGGLETG